MIILGLNAFHADSAATILIDGKIIAAIEEERINRIKHWSGLPISAIKECLSIAQVSLDQVDYISINQDFFANFFQKLNYLLFNKVNVNFLIERFHNKKIRTNILYLLKKELGGLKKNCKLISIEHHYSHLASAFFDSPYQESVNLSVDGFGDFTSMAWGVGYNNNLRIDNKILFPHSLGIFYEAFTQFLGFLNYGDEYKVMGLSSYGFPSEVNKIKKIINLKKNGEFQLNLDYFNHHKKRINYSWNNSAPSQERLFNDNIKNLLGDPRLQTDSISQYQKNIASSVQKVYEETLFHILNYIYDKYKIKNLTLSGGCAQNSLANGKILENTPFTSLFVPSNAGDAGGAVGSAYLAWNKLSKLRPQQNKTAYLGNHYSNQYVENLITQNKEKLALENCKYIFISETNHLCKFVAQEISKNKVIGWFQGKMEWGPRSLGNRSIIADPRNTNVKDLLNSKIKRRESFRPFAPSILLEEANHWFENLSEEEPYMSSVFKFKKHKMGLVPGVVHVDGTGRIQTVKLQDNEKYYKLIKNFQLLTGVPILLNTSFNENEPIVFKPEHALSCFLRTKMDILVLENWVISRQ